MASMTEQSHRPRRRWFRFSVRSLLLLVVLIAIPLSWKVNRARNQRVAVAELQKLNARIIYDYEIVAINGSQTYRNLPPPGPKRLTDLLGIEYFVEVIEVGSDSPQVTDETIALIAQALPELTFISFTSAPEVTDSGLIHLAEMHKLEGVCLFSKGITGVGLVHLTGLKRLKSLDVSGWATDAALEHISKLTRLERLQLCEAVDITDTGLADIAKLTNLRSLEIGSGGWFASGIQNCMKVTDQGLVNLHGLTKLELLDLNTIGATRAGIDKLRKALPNCKIQWNLNGPHDPDPIHEADGEPVSRPAE